MNAGLPDQAPGSAVSVSPTYGWGSLTSGTLTLAGAGVGTPFPPSGMIAPPESPRRTSDALAVAARTGAKAAWTSQALRATPESQLLDVIENSSASGPLRLTA